VRGKGAGWFRAGARGRPACCAEARSGGRAASVAPPRGPVYLRRNVAADRASAPADAAAGSAATDATARHQAGAAHAAGAPDGHGSGSLPRGDSRRKGAYAAAGLALAFAIMACGGPSYRNGVYEDEEARFQVEPPPAGWRPIRVGEEPDLAYHHPELDAVLQINASCEQDLDIPLQALTLQLLAGFTEREVRDRDTIPFDGREALRTHLSAKLDGVPRELLVLVAKKNGCVYDLVLVAAPGPRFLQASEDYARLVASFRAGRGGARPGEAVAPDRRRPPSRAASEVDG